MNLLFSISCKKYIGYFFVTTTSINGITFGCYVLDFEIMLPKFLNNKIFFCKPSFYDN